MRSPVIRIDAIRHERTAKANLSRPVDDHDLSMPLDHFIRAFHRDEQAPLIVGTGLDEAAAAARGRIITRPAFEGMRDAGIVDHRNIIRLIVEPSPRGLALSIG